MRASRALAVAATAGAAIGLCAPLAAANNGPTNVTVSPTRVHQGGQLAISVMGCGHGGKVSSNAFPKTALTINPSGHAAATPRIYDHATPGQYNLAVKCNDHHMVVTRTFTVVRGHGARGGLGGSMAPSSTEMAIGAALVGTAAIGGGLFISRRRRLSGGKV
ncbi:hypothetical protein QWM81_17780 [Streptomyces ficellus]|uniref:LPXTG cell wall anchor domain-containing protein n=1 Tax=Streptomyces ficellus TaxID=1977088 RepID=A0ABT7Z8M3_9ACTN|nr:hypothetical protein [Streptomyces ficellus]MDN3295866.1 hypothetical protein [Streptomyces ficellus]